MINSHINSRFSTFIARIIPTLNSSHKSLLGVNIFQVAKSELMILANEKASVEISDQSEAWKQSSRSVNKAKGRWIILCKRRADRGVKNHPMGHFLHMITLE